MDPRQAPGWPGSPARWTSAAKSGVGTALGGSAVWFTLSHGILNEVYAPRMDEAATRDLGLVVTAGGGFFSEIKRHARHSTERPLPGVPYCRLVSTCSHGRYRVETEVISDPGRWEGSDFSVSVVEEDRGERQDEPGAAEAAAPAGASA